MNIHTCTHTRINLLGRSLTFERICQATTCGGSKRKNKIKKHNKKIPAGHHVCHGGYNAEVGIGNRFHRATFARGPVRRFMDWCDWMLPEVYSVCLCV
jgi:hypothetical protein